MKVLLKLLTIISTIFLLTGCLYPEDQLAQNQIPYDDQVVAVQSAVDKYREASGGLLPIKNRDMETHIYQKYPIDFNKISPKYIAEPPGNAYESGGVYVYVLVDVETDPKVKLLDLRTTEQVRDLNLRVEMYRSSNGYPPYKDTVDKNVFTLDYKKLGYEEEPSVVSPYTNNNLPLVITNTGEIFVDYRIDLFDALKKYEHNYKSGEDIRNILVENTMFVPANSLPYTIDEKNEPIFLNK